MANAAFQRTDPDRIFMRSWATSLLDDVRTRLRKEYAQRNRQALFDELSSWLTESPAPINTNLSHRLNLSMSAVKVALHRLRTRFGALLREVVGGNRRSSSEVDREIRELLE